MRTSLRNRVQRRSSSHRRWSRPEADALECIEPRPVVESPTPGPPPQTERARAQQIGGPEDVATYPCTCGYVFEASVSASVACPNCGDAQAW